MPNIDVPIADFVSSKGAKSIWPIPPAGPNQRGPTCGFYALAFDMLYWFLRQGEFGGDFGVTEPLKARTNNENPAPTRLSVMQKGGKRSGAQGGNYSSLRHFGKHNLLTAYGSVFNAENILKVARGNGSQYGGQFDGHVIDVSGVDEFSAKVKALIELECPVIVPFDVSVQTADPTTDTGKAAHWAVILGTYKDGDDYVIHYHWGKFHYCPLAAFAVSNGQLTSNMFLDFKKCEVWYNTTLFRRGYMTEGSINSFRSKGFKVVELAGPVTNFEFCKPMSMEELLALRHLQEKFPDLAGVLSLEQLNRHGFDPMHLANAGLKDKIVAIYPTVIRDVVRTVS